MFENDYVMRLIKEIVRIILKMMFNIDSSSPSAELMEDAEERATLENLIKMIDTGNINEAENSIYELTEDGSKEYLKLALIFYSHLNGKSDEFLIEHNFSREEVQAGLKNLISRYGLTDMADILI